ncbi:MAG: 1-acyl-sn-glycerol-3-phosphate acyltransferase [Planctomycetaceae bacterium]|nr:1-acyl-sn-glycerol-3-phosphate acyltransferase [Planctomycetaceae bacterium]
MSLSPMQSLLFALNYTMVRTLWRAKVRGRFPLADDQGGIIVCNHRCPLDPAIVALAVRRVIHWMVAKEYYEYPPFRPLLQYLEVIPVRRGGIDAAATRAAIRLVARGELVGILPEGRINTTADLMLPARLGAALMAMRARCPIVPCYIDGAPYDGTTLGCLLIPARVRLDIGQPIELSAYFHRAANRAVLEEVTIRYLRAIAELAGRSDYWPRVAGRLDV